MVIFFFILISQILNQHYVVAQADWSEVKQAIERYDNVGNCIVTIGNNEDPSLMSYTKGNTKQGEEMRLWSASKWVSGVVIMAVVHEGYLGLDDLVSDYLSYWTMDKSDFRSQITLKHLLGFVSGYTPTGAYVNEFWCIGETHSKCAKTIYDWYSGGWKDEDKRPGKNFDYNLLHLQLAGGMVEAATGMCFAALADKYVFTPAQMMDTYWVNSKNPKLGVDLVTTPADYNRFLHLYFTDYLLPKEERIKMEELPFPNANFNTGSKKGGSETDKYGLCNWFQCQKKDGLLTDWSKCKVADVHHSSGSGGFRPSVNRKLKYWYIIAFESINSNIGWAPNFFGYGGNQDSNGLQEIIEPMINKLFGKLPLNISDIKPVWDGNRSFQKPFPIKNFAAGFNRSEIEKSFEKPTINRSVISEERCKPINEPRACYLEYGCEWDAYITRKCIKKECSHISDKQEWTDASCKGSFSLPIKDEKKKGYEKCGRRFSKIFSGAQFSKVFNPIITMLTIIMIHGFP